MCRAAPGARALLTVLQSRLPLEAGVRAGPWLSNEAHRQRRAWASKKRRIASSGTRRAVSTLTTIPVGVVKEAP